MAHIQNYKFFNLRVLILHGYGATTKDCFYEWLGDKLTDLGCIVTIPSLPNPDNPLDTEQAKSISGQYDVIVAHSFGCVVAMKYLPRIGYRVKHLILISGFVDNDFYDDDPDIEGLQKASNWKFQYDVIKSKCDNIHVLYPETDTSVTHEQISDLANYLGTKVKIFKEEEDHACGRKEPAILEFIKKVVL